MYSDETLFNTVLVKGEDLSREALKMAHAKIPFGRFFVYAQEHRYLSFCRSIAGWMSKEREGDGMRGHCRVLRSVCRRKDALGIGDIPEG